MTGIISPLYSGGAPIAGGGGATGWTAGESTGNGFAVVYHFNPDGTTDWLTEGVSASGTWLVPGTGAALYEIMAHKNWGRTPSTGDALDAWLNLAAQRGWGFSAATTLDKECELAVTIRRVSDLVVMATGTIHLLSSAVGDAGGGGGGGGGAL
jgi:hypothetical protein